MSGQRPIKGFRPGKEPPQLKKRRAKQQFGEMSGTQEKLVELFAERTPEQARAMIRRWELSLLAIAGVLVVAAAALALWSLIATAVVGVLAVVALFLWWRFRGQRDAYQAMADAVSGGGRRKRKR